MESSTLAIAVHKDGKESSETPLLATVGTEQGKLSSVDRGLLVTGMLDGRLLASGERAIHVDEAPEFSYDRTFGPCVLANEGSYSPILNGYANTRQSHPYNQFGCEKEPGVFLYVSEGFNLDFLRGSGEFARADKNVPAGDIVAFEPVDDEQ